MTCAPDILTFGPIGRSSDTTTLLLVYINWLIGNGLYTHCAGVIARHPNYLPYIKQALTVEVVTDYFKQLLEEDSKVER